MISPKISQPIITSHVISAKRDIRKIAEHDAQNRHQRHQRRLERPVQLGMPHAQHPHSSAHNRECQQRADVHQVGEPRDRQERGKQGRKDSEHDRRDPWRAELRMDRRGPLPQQPVLRHRVEDARLPQQHHQHHRGQARTRRRSSPAARPSSRPSRQCRAPPEPPTFSVL